MIPQNFSKWTRAEWQEFESIKNKAFQLAPEEIEEQEIINKQNMIDYTKKYLDIYSIEFTGEEEDFTKLYKSYIMDLPDMKEWLGKELQTKVDYFSKEKNNLKDFCNFVIQYES